jgi:type I restriction enzyme S subunit
MKRYPVYKDSGVEGLGEIPEHWEVKRLASLGKFSKGSTISKSDLVENGLPVILYGDIYTKYNLRAETIFHFITQDLAANSKQIYKGDLLFTGSGETREDIGKCIVYNGNSEVYAGGDIIIFRQKNTDSLFLAYFFSSNYAINKKAMNSRGDIVVHIYASSLRDIYIPLPPLSEQKTIAHFLDYKIEQIEQYIRNKQRLIELLNEQKAAIINRAVTKGINPELTKIFFEQHLIDVNSESCQLISIRNLRRMGILEIQDGNHGELHPTSTDYVEEGIPFIMANDIRNGQVNLKSCTFITKEKADKLRIGFSKPKDILLTHKGTVGETTIVPDNIGFPYIMLTPQVTYYRVLTKAINPSFLCYCFQSSFFQEQLKIIGSKQSTRAFVGIVAQRDLIIILPAKKEQDKICNFLDNETFKINQVIAQVEKEIELIQEYRTTLISDAVTGKIDVRSTSAIETTLTA